LVDREFRTSRRALNVLSVRAGLPEQATLSYTPTKPDVRVFQVRQIGLKEEGIDLEVMPDD